MAIPSGADRAGKLAAVVGGFALLMSFLASPSGASDGAVEISQACAISTGCLVGDAPGFPIFVTAGHYVLTSDLSVTNPADVAIWAVTGGASIDLNGFTIAGPATCTGDGSTVSCAPAGTGTGIVAPVGSDRLLVRNGRIRGFASGGISAAKRSSIRNVVAESNGFVGIAAADWSLVSESTAHQNGFIGISVGHGSLVERSVASANFSGGIGTGLGSAVLDSAAYDNGTDGIAVREGSVVRGNSCYLNEGHGISANVGSLVSDNVAYQNEDAGIFSAVGGSIQRNTVYANGGFGLNLNPPASYRENTITSNTDGTVLTGLDMGANSCDGATSCP